MTKKAFRAKNSRYHLNSGIHPHSVGTKMPFLCNGRSPEVYTVLQHISSKTASAIRLQGLAPTARSLGRKENGILLLFIAFYPV